MDEEDRIEAARKIFAGPIAFLKSAPALKFLPDQVVGRSPLPGGPMSASRRCSMR
jgi:GTP-binding protein